MYAKESQKVLKVDWERKEITDCEPLEKGILMTIKVELWKVKYYLITKVSCTFFLKMQMGLPHMHILNITLTQMQLNIVLKQIDISFILCTLNVLLKNALCKLLMISVMNVRSNLIGDYLFSVRFSFWLVCIAIESSMNFILKL